MLFGCCTGQEMPCDVDVVLEHILKVMEGGNTMGNCITGK